jgi:hypothetical protein
MTRWSMLMCRTTKRLVMPVQSRSKNGVASLAYVAGIHVFLLSCRPKAWMAGTSPAMTTERNGRKSKNERKRKRNAGRRSVSWPARKRRAVRTNERAACAALRLRARSPAGVPPRLSPEGLFIPKAQSGPGFVGQGVHVAGFTPPTPHPLAAMHPARRS